MYGGSTTSILVNIPGEAASVVTCWTGTRWPGRAGPVRRWASRPSALSSAGRLGIVGSDAVAPPLAEMALSSGLPEYFALMSCGLVILTFLASGSMLKALMMAAFGLFLGTIGMDPIIGTPRFTFGISDLMDGLGIVPVVMGLFGISEVLLNIEEGDSAEIFVNEDLHLLPEPARIGETPSGRSSAGSVIGFFLGILPGGGAVISSFTSYAIEKKISKHPEKFGTGIIDGVAGPETANNAASGGASSRF